MLKAKQVENSKAADKPYRLLDGKGLYLEVRSSGAKFWRYRYRIYPHGWDKKKLPTDSMFALGEWVRASTGIGGQYTLEEARTERDKARALVKQGIHPVHRKQAERVRRAAEATNTFEGVAREWIEKNRPNWSAGYAKQAEGTLEADVFRYIGGLPIREVTAAHLLDIVQRVEGRGAKTLAILIRQWCGAIFRFAISTLRADADPSAALKGAITRDQVQHNPHLAEADLPGYFEALDAYGGTEQTKILMGLSMLLWQRPSEIRAAKWSEFDLDEGNWIIPAARMKMKQTHHVPLQDQSIALLRKLHAITGTREHLFPGRDKPTQPMNKGTIREALCRMGYGGKLTAHGYRGTVRTILTRLQFKDEVIEFQLAHKEGNATKAAYNHWKYEPERRKMMQAWADHLSGLRSGANVVAIGSKRA